MQYTGCMNPERISAPFTAIAKTSEQSLHRLDSAQLQEVRKTVSGLYEQGGVARPALAIYLRFCEDEISELVQAGIISEEEALQRETKLTEDTYKAVIADIRSLANRGGLLPRL